MQDFKKLLQKSQVFDEKTKRELLEYFDSLSEKQKDLIEEILENEKRILLEFLRTLKEEKDMKPEQIKYMFHSLSRKKVLQEEEQELVKNNTEDLLLSLELL